jgi:hypothetical protein
MVFNTSCCCCSKPLHRRPRDLKYKSYCSMECYKKAKRIVLICPTCKKEFWRYKEETGHRRKKYCSKSCANRNRIGMRYGGGRKCDSRRRLELFQKASGIKTCSVVGCAYSRTLDLHRLVEGKNGGGYILGNMFAICPNHHAEITRGFAQVTAISKFSLRITYLMEPAINGRTIRLATESSSKLDERNCLAGSTPAPSAKNFSVT